MIILLLCALSKFNFLTGVEKKYKKLLADVPFTNEKKSDSSSIIINNTLGWERKGVIALDNKGQSANKKRRVSTDSDLTQIDSFGQTLGK